MLSAVTAALVSSSAFIAVLVGWQALRVPHHRSVVDTLTYCLWVLPLFAIMALLNWISVLAGRQMSPSRGATGALAFVVVVGLTLLVSKSTRSIGGAITQLQFGVTIAFALANAASLAWLLPSGRQRQ